VGLLFGVGVWGYKLMVRDVSGVPVVRAIEGPMRVQPEIPGGQQADHQGLSVNTIAAHGTAAAPADRLMLAPRPVALADEDAPMGKIETAEIEEVEPEPQPVYVNGKPVIEDDGAKVASDEALAALQAGSVEALVNELTAGIRPLSGTTETENTGRIVQPAPLNSDVPLQAILVSAVLETPAIAPSIVAAVVTGPGPKLSLRPQLRPVRLEVSSDVEDATNVAVTAAVTAAIAEAMPEDIDADSLPAGTRLAQLGAYDSIDIARAAWDQMNVKFGDYLDGKSRVIQKASSGGRVFYRLRAMGFEDISDARRFCSALVAENADCIPVTTR
jgi:hypothetical protein